MKNVQIKCALVLTFFGVVLIGMAFWVPPVETIHPSVLTAFGEILTFAGTILGIDYKYRSRH